MIDLTSEDDGLNGEDGHEEVVFVEPPKAVVRAVVRAPGGQQGLSQIMQSAKRKRDREEDRRAVQPGYNNYCCFVFMISTAFHHPPVPPL